MGLGGGICAMVGGGWAKVFKVWNYGFVMKRMFGSYVPRKGFGWAVFFTFVTFVLVFCGVSERDVPILVLSLVSGFVGLYFTKKSWVPYWPKKKVRSSKRRK
ncbi:MAG: hypothetical protein V1889_02910 [archaeon]